MYTYVYTYSYVEMHREDFKSRVLLVWQNLNNSQATDKAEKHAHLLFLLPVLLSVQKHNEPFSTDGKIKAVT